MRTLGSSKLYGLLLQVNCILRPGVGKHLQFSVEGCITTAA